MAAMNPEQRDPVTAHPQPDSPEQEQSHPSWTGPMDPPPDHGEASYEGRGLLEGRASLCGRELAERFKVSQNTVRKAWSRRCRRNGSRRRGRAC